jgi:hypothetical protein
VSAAAGFDAAVLRAAVLAAGFAVAGFLAAVDFAAEALAVVDLLAGLLEPLDPALAGFAWDKGAAGAGGLDGAEETGTEAADGTAEPDFTAGAGANRRRAR